MRKSYSRDFLISEIKRFVKETGKVPTGNDFEKNYSYPSVRVYQKSFGTWNNALTLAGCDVNVNREHSRERIIRRVEIFYRNHKRSPKHNELGFSQTVVRQYWESFNELLEESGVPVNQKKHSLKTKEDGIKLLLELFEQLGRIPTGQDIDNFTEGNRAWFAKKFGSFNQALVESGLLKKAYTDKNEWVQDSIEGLKKLFLQLKNAPTASQYDDYARQHYLLNRKALESNLGMKFGDICFNYLQQANQYKKSKEQLYEELLGLRELLGRTPMAKELKLYGLSSKQQYRRMFKMSYNQMITSFGWIPFIKRFHKGKEELLKDYKNLYEELKRLPLREDIDARENMASYATYIYQFGSLEGVWKMINLPYEKELLSLSYGLGITCIDKQGNICKSYYEMLISNVLIDNETKFEKNKPYKEIITKDSTKRTFDWFLSEYNICVEYFGMYDNEKETDFIAKYTKKAMKKILDCQEAGVNLISIFPSDLENLMENVKVKFGEKGINLVI